MQAILTPSQMRALDTHMIDEMGIPGLLLMEHAALGVVQAIIELLPAGGEVLIACGGGNNGGDGLAVLRLLAMRGVKARAILLCMAESLRGDARKQYEMALSCNLPVDEALSVESVENVALAKAAVLVDALFGTGLARPVDGHYKRMIEQFNAAGKPVVAVDIPSGVDGATGEVLGVAVHADVTVTFQHKKLGHMLFPGRSHAGALCVVPIGIPFLHIDCLHEWEQRDIALLLPKRPADSHKGNNGRALLLAGSEHYAGAAILSANAALRGGCGLLHLCVPQGIHTIVKDCPGAICHPVGRSAQWDESATQDVTTYLYEANVLAIGPGLGNGQGLPALLSNLLATKKPLVIDADGLNCLAAHRELFSLLHRHVVLTPHPGEMARLIGSNAQFVAQYPVELARRYAKEWGCTVLLKGATSVIACPEQAALNTTGNAGLAKGGSGDVLTGILLALLAQGIAPFEAACAAAYLLGSAADEALHLLGTRALLPTDVVDALGS